MKKGDRAKPAFINAPRETANYDEEDMDEVSDKENSQSETEAASEQYDEGEQSLFSNSALARQRAINQRYLMADPSQALQTSTMNVF